MLEQQQSIIVLGPVVCGFASTEYEPTQDKDKGISNHEFGSCCDGDGLKHNNQFEQVATDRRRIEHGIGCTIDIDNKYIKWFLNGQDFDLACVQLQNLQQENG